MRDQQPLAPLDEIKEIHQFLVVAGKWIVTNILPSRETLDLHAAALLLSQENEENPFFCFYRSMQEVELPGWSGSLLGGKVFDDPGSWNSEKVKDLLHLANLAISRAAVRLSLCGQLGPIVFHMYDAIKLLIDVAAGLVDLSMPDIDDLGAPDLNLKLEDFPYDS